MHRGIPISIYQDRHSALRRNDDACSAAARGPLIAHLRDKGTLSVFHSLPLNLSAIGRRFGGRANDCPVAEEISERLLRLPFYNTLGEAEQEYVVAAIRSWQGS